MPRGRPRKKKEATPRTTKPVNEVVDEQVSAAGVTQTESLQVDEPDTVTSNEVTQPEPEWEDKASEIAKLAEAPVETEVKPELFRPAAESTKVRVSEGEATIAGRCRVGDVIRLPNLTYNMKIQKMRGLNVVCRKENGTPIVISTGQRVILIRE